MSSIIDALKKSDNNRTNESGANVNQIKFGHQPAPKSRRGFWLLVALLLLVVLAVFAWSQGWHHSVINQTKSWLGSDQLNAGQAAQLEPEPATKGNEQTAAQAATKPSKDQAHKLTPPKANEVKAKTLAAELTQARPDKQSQQLPIVADQETDKDKNNSEQTKAATNSEQETLELLTNKNTAAEEIDAAAKKAESIAKQNRKDLEPKLKQDYLLMYP